MVTCPRCGGQDVHPRNGLSKVKFPPSSKPHSIRVEWMACLPCAMPFTTEGQQRLNDDAYALAQVTAETVARPKRKRK